jgi:hypothetical protein
LTSTVLVAAALKVVVMALSVHPEDQVRSSGRAFG